MLEHGSFGVQNLLETILYITAALGLLSLDGPQYIRHHTNIVNDNGLIGCLQTTF